MALEPVTTEIFSRILAELGIQSLNRPHAAFIDPGDFGTIFSYIPIFKGEFEKIPLELQKFVYVLEKGKYGLVAFVPRDFCFPGSEDITSVTEVYNHHGNLNELTYVVSGKEKVYRVEHPLRRELLQTFARKKKIPVKKIIRS